MARGVLLDHLPLVDTFGERKPVKLVLFQQSDTGPQLPGMLTDRGVVDISGVVRSSYTPQLVMEGIIDDFERLRPTLEMIAETATALPLSSVRLRAPLPRPHKIFVRSPTIGSTRSGRPGRSTCS